MSTPYSQSAPEISSGHRVSRNRSRRSSAAVCEKGIVKGSMAIVLKTGIAAKRDKKHKKNPTQRRKAAKVKRRESHTNVSKRGRLEVKSESPVRIFYVSEFSDSLSLAPCLLSCLRLRCPSLDLCGFASLRENFLIRYLSCTALDYQTNGNFAISVLLLADER